MTEFTWWQRGVVYQIYPRSFMDSNNDGIGDLQGVIDRLDVLNDGTETSLGIDAIWLSPFFPSPMKDFGYDVADYVDVDPMFGDLETFDRLVAEAHRRGIKIIIDYVPNHTSDEHPWFKESRSSRDNPRRNWYIWRDPKPDGSPPNNWGSVFGGSAWEWDEHTQQYYFHQFVPGQPDLNWRNPEVRAAMYDVLRFWMKRGVDGFRMDVVYMVWKHPDMPDQPLLETARGRGEGDLYGMQHQIYSMNYEGIHDIMKQLRRVVDEYHDRVMIGEIWLPLDERLKYHGEDADEFHMPFNFDFIAEGDFFSSRGWRADTYRAVVDAYEAALPSGGWPNYVLGNHDVSRLASRLGSQERARLAAMMLLTLRGTPTIYMGEELGMVNGDIKPEQMQDPQGINLGVAHTRDVCRTPMQWSSAQYAGFSNVEPWLPVNDDYPERNYDAQKDDPRSMFSLYRNLLWYRKQHDSLAVGDYNSLESPENIYMFERTHGDEKHLILLNFGTEPATVSLHAPGEIVFNTLLDRSGSVSGEITLAGEEGVLIRVE